MTKFGVHTNCEIRFMQTKSNNNNNNENNKINKKGRSSHDSIIAIAYTDLVRQLKIIEIKTSTSNFILLSLMHDLSEFRQLVKKTINLQRATETGVGITQNAHIDVFVHVYCINCISFT